MRDRTAIAAAADYFFAGGLLGPVVALATGAFPFGRTEHVRASLERVGSYLDAGWNVIVFPEGTRSTTGRLGPLKSGIGLLATQLEVAVVPVGIRGADRILPKGATLPRRRGRVLVRIGIAPHLRARLHGARGDGSDRDGDPGPGRALRVPLRALTNAEYVADVAGADRRLPGLAST